MFEVDCSIKYVAVKVTVSPLARFPSYVPVPTKVGSLVSVKLLPSPSVIVSVIPTLVRFTFPVFSTTIVYVIVSPSPVCPSGLSSETVYVLTTSIDGFGEI